MKALTALTTTFVATLFSGSLMAMPMLAFNNAGDTVLGVNNITFNGVNYDTQFIDGTCNDLYNGCQDFSPANTSAIATGIVDEMIAALTAALFQYNGNISGCENNTGCEAYLVFGDGLSGSFLARTLVIDSPDQFTSEEDNLGSFDSNVATDSGTYIIATLSAAPVPLPPTWLLLLAGLVSIAAIREAKRRSQPPVQDATTYRGMLKGINNTFERDDDRTF